MNEVSAAETYVWLLDVGIGREELLTPKSAPKRCLQQRADSQRRQGCLHRPPMRTPNFSVSSISI